MNATIIVFWITLILIVFMVGFSIVRRRFIRSAKSRIMMAMIVAVSTFILVYLGGAIKYASLRYARAVAISDNRAHTRVGIEGYEYIFEPDTQIFIDKILPNSNIIIANIVLHDYLGINLNSGCSFLDNDICKWMRFDIYYPHDQTPTLLKIISYASITALLAGIVFYLFGASSIDPYKRLLSANSPPKKR